MTLEANAQSALLTTDRLNLPMRSFGYFIGDVLTQRIDLLSSNLDLAEAGLDSGLRISEYLYRYPGTINDSNMQHQWLEIRYQIINAPITTMTIELPALSLTTLAGEALQAAPWQLNVGPLTVEALSETSTPASHNNITTAPMRPNQRAEDLVQALDSTPLVLSLTALLATLVIWLSWWITRHYKDSRRLPFAVARRAIKQMPATERNQAIEAWVALHRAFNQLGGKTITTSTLTELFHTAPWLSPLRHPIEEFYSASATRFYQPSVKHQPIAVNTLCQSLYLLEKQQSQPSDQPVVRGHV